MYTTATGLLYVTTLDPPLNFLTRSHSRPYFTTPTAKLFLSLTLLLN